MTLVAVLVLLAQVPQDASQVRGLGYSWLLEMIHDPAQACAKKLGDRARFVVRLNTRGEVALSTIKVSGPDIRECVERIVQPSPVFSAESSVVEVSVTVQHKLESPERCEVERREPKPAKLSCASHRDCGAGQGCFETNDLDAGSTSQLRCIDYRSWLISNVTK